MDYPAEVPVWLMGLCRRSVKPRCQGVKQDHAEAVRWYRKAAEQGDADAQCMLGVAYENGRGVKQDASEAVWWYRKAAEQGLVNVVAALKRLSAGAVTINASPLMPKATATLVRVQQLWNR